NPPRRQGREPPPPELPPPMEEDALAVPLPGAAAGARLIAGGAGVSADGGRGRGHCCGTGACFAGVFALFLPSLKFWLKSRRQLFHASNRGSMRSHTSLVEPVVVVVPRDSDEENEMGLAVPPQPLLRSVELLVDCAGLARE